MQLDGAEHLMSGSNTHGNGHVSLADEEDGSSVDFVELHLTPADESTCPSRNQTSVDSSVCLL